MDLNELKAMLETEAKQNSGKHSMEVKTGMAPIKGGPNKLYNFEQLEKEENKLN